MRKLAWCVVVGAVMGWLAVEASAQEPDANEGPARFLRMIPVMAALDTNEDGEISAEEIEQAAAKLKTLDKNGDGKLTQDELRPEFPGFGGGRGGTPGAPGGPGGRGGRGGFGGPADPETMVARMLEQFDKNDDGKLAKDEVPELMQNMFARADADQDGVATKEELLKALPQRPFGGGGFGPPSPEATLDRMFEFDSDKDGKLSREELQKYAAERGRGFGRGPEGGRPERPQRPD